MSEISERFSLLFGRERRDDFLKARIAAELRISSGASFNIKRQIPNVDVVRSAWRRFKKNVKDAIIRDLELLRDVKGGGGVKGKSTAGGTGSPASGLKR